VAGFRRTLSASTGESTADRLTGWFSAQRVRLETALRAAVARNTPRTETSTTCDQANPELGLLFEEVTQEANGSDTVVPR
jgi:hypothetical protein